MFARDASSFRRQRRDVPRSSREGDASRRHPGSARMEVVMLRRSLFVSAFASALALSNVASAQEELPPDTSIAKQEQPSTEQFAIVANPLSTIVGRYGIDVTWMPELHHALVVNPFFHH